MKKTPKRFRKATSYVRHTYVIRLNQEAETYPIDDQIEHLVQIARWLGGRPPRRFRKFDKATQVAILRARVRELLPRGWTIKVTQKFILIAPTV